MANILNTSQEYFIKGHPRGVCSFSFGFILLLLFVRQPSPCLQLVCLSPLTPASRLTALPFLFLPHLVLILLILAKANGAIM